LATAPHKNISRYPKVEFGARYSYPKAEHMYAQHQRSSHPEH
jgi:hypothetical protein